MSREKPVVKDHWPEWLKDKVRLILQDWALRRNLNLMKRGTQCDLCHGEKFVCLVQMLGQRKYPEHVLLMCASCRAILKNRWRYLIPLPKEK